MECTRRRFFGALARSLVTDGVDTLRAVRSAWAAPIMERSDRRIAPPYLRPPGALPEAEFLAACTRCTKCQDACPHLSIRRLGPEFGNAAGTPAIIPGESPCYLCEAMPCIDACEPRALMRVDRHAVRMGLAVIDERRCYAAQSQPCDYCVTRCPLGPRAIRFDPRGLPTVQGDACAGCGVCSYLCPAQAVTIVTRPR